MLPSSRAAAAGKAESWHVNKRGQRLYTVKFAPVRPPVARFFFHHGVGEHCGRYDKVFNRMSESGIAVYSFDAHGHGKSEPQEFAERAFVEKFPHLMDDFQGVIDSAMDKGELPVPCFIGGQSMGGLVATHLSLRAQDRWAGLLLHSPALDVEWTPILRIQAKLGGLLAAVVPRKRIVPAVRPQDMSQDPAVVKDYLEDPLVTHGNVCARTGNELLNAFRKLADRSKELHIPLYIGHGDEDHCTSLPASKRFVASVSSRDATLHVYKGGYHELLHGPEWQEATDRMIEWMTTRAARGRSRL